MAVQFKPNEPVKTKENFVDVVNELKKGTHTFQLVVVDDEGNISDPVRATVVVLRGGVR
jgi:hypothetical protein